MENASHILLSKYIIFLIFLFYSLFLRYKPPKAYAYPRFKIAIGLQRKSKATMTLLA